MIEGFKRRLFIQIGIALGIIVLLTIFIILLNIDINNHRLSIDTSKEVLALRNKTIEFLSSSNNDVARAAPMLANLKNILPPADQLFMFQDELPKIAKGYGVTASIEFPKGGKVGSTPTDAGSVKFDMFLSGGYDGLVGFLKAFEAYPYFINMDTITIVRTGDTPDEFSLKTNGKIFIQ